MKKLTIAALAVFMLSGCANMTQGQKTTAWIIGGVLVGAAIASSSDGGSVRRADIDDCFIGQNGAGQNTAIYCR